MQRGARSRSSSATKLTKGLGAGADPTVGKHAALEDTDKLIEAIEGADMVFVTAGLGGGTGTGAAPVIASLASRARRPDHRRRAPGRSTFEGRKRARQAERGPRGAARVAVDTRHRHPQRAAAADRSTASTPLHDAFARRRRRPAAGRPGHLRPDHCCPG
ncbi:MAG: hypothetical protein MZU95_04895 [Desulfomicrobium escambiense]|nr:hypothetical protein [Desulfomicrobium escambiense]